MIIKTTLLSLLALYALSLLGCASPYPLGMEKEQWQQLSAEERKSLLLKQQQIQAKERLARIEAQARARELEHQETMAENARLDKLYQNPEQGNVIMLNVLSGTYQRGKNLYSIQGDSYQLARGEKKTVRLSLQNNKGYISTQTVYLHYALHGNAVYISLRPFKQTIPRIALLRDGRWACGSRYAKSLQQNYESMPKLRVFIKEHTQNSTNCFPSRKYKR